MSSSSCEHQDELASGLDSVEAKHSVASPSNGGSRASVLFVNRSYWPDMEATGQLLTELCESLANSSDLDISVLCGQPNYGAPGAEYKSFGSEEHNGVSVLRTWHTKFDKSRFWGRAVNFITFCMSAFLSLMFGKRPDVIVCETDPPLGPIAAALAATLRRTKLVVYLQDIYPDIAVECGKLREGFSIKVLRRFLVWCYRRADRIVVVSEDMRVWLNSHGVSEDKVDVIHNWVDVDTVYPIKTENAFRAEHCLDGKFVVMYSGNVGQTQRFDVMLDAAEKLRTNEEIVFAIVGGGVKRLSVEHEVERRQLSNVRFMEYQPKSRLAASLSAADIQLVLLDQRMTRLMMPSKLYSALASGTPVLGIGASKSHLSRIVVDNDCGWFFEESQLDDLVNKVLQLSVTPSEISAAGQAGRTLAIERFGRDISVKQFSQLLSLTAPVQTAGKN